MNQIAENILSILENGWNNADGQHFAQPFASTSQFVDIRGVLHANASPAQLGVAHQGIFDTIYKGSRVKYLPIQTVTLSDSSFLLNVAATLDAPIGPLMGTNHSVITMLISKQENEWKILSFHNTLKAREGR